MFKLLIISVISFYLSIRFYNIIKQIKKKQKQKLRKFYIYKLYKPGTKPKKSGKYIERDTFGKYLFNARRATIKLYEGDKLPPTSKKGHRWQLLYPIN